MAEPRKQHWMETLLRSIMNPDYIEPPPPLTQFEYDDPRDSEWDTTAKRRKRNEDIRRRKLGIEDQEPKVDLTGSLPSVTPPDPNAASVDPLELLYKESPQSPRPGDAGTPSGGQRVYLDEGADAAPEMDAQEKYLRDYVSNMDQDKVARIRAQARAKGRRGSLEGGQATGEDFLGSAFGGGGGFTVAPDSPEIRQRLAERDSWLADQTTRDAQWERDLARQKGDQAGQNAAAEQLQNLRSLKVAENEQRFKQAIAQSMMGSGGKVPRDKAASLIQAGIPISAYAIGSAPEDVDRFLASEVDTAQRILSSINPYEAAGNENLIKTTELAHASMILAQEMRKNIANGMDPDEARKIYENQVSEKHFQLGLSTAQNIYNINAGPTQTVPGE